MDFELFNFDLLIIVVGDFIGIVEFGSGIFNVFYSMILVEDKGFFCVVDRENGRI